VNTVADLLLRRADLEQGEKIDENVTILPPQLWARLLRIAIRKANMAHTTKRKLYLENNLAKRRKILQEIHDTPVGGHPGIANT
jgi:hypothetical protein